MKILHVYKTYYPDTHGGIEQFIKQLVISTKHLEIEHKLFTTTRKPSRTFEIDGMLVHAVHSSFEIASCPFALGCLRQFKDLVNQADLVHYHFPWPFADLMHFLARVQKPSIVTYQSDVVRQNFLLQLYKPLMLSFMNRMDSIIATTENYLASSPYLQKFKQKVKIISMGIEEKKPLAPDNPTMIKLKNEVGAGFFLFIGVLRYYKGLNFLLQAVAETNLRLIIAGQGPKMAELQRQARQLNLSNVKFLGEVSDEEKLALIQLSKAIIMPSHLRSEAYGMILIEGQMLRKPLISTELRTGTSYINLDKLTGFVVPPKNPLALREAMLKLNNDKRLAQTMGDASYKRYQELFTANDMGNKYYQLYKGLIK